MSNDPNEPTRWSEILEKLLDGDLSPEEEAALLAELPTVPADADEWLDQALEEEQPLDLDELRATQDRADQAFDEWHASTRENGLWSTWLAKEAEFRLARDAFIAVGGDRRISNESRAAALMNAANALSTVGRKFDALELYERAAKLRPDDGMVRGHRGMVISQLAAFLGDHNLLVHRAIEDLKFTHEAVHVDHGAQEVFDHYLHRLEHHLDDPAPEMEVPEYSDPYLTWAWENDLLLSTAFGAKPPEDKLDSVHLRHLVTGIDEMLTGSPVPGPVGAINAIKRDYLSARFLAWLALEEPSEAQLAERSRSASYVDTLDYARWDLSAGLMTMSYSAAINLADKIGTFLALWLKLPAERRNERNWAFGSLSAAEAKLPLDQRPPRPVLPELSSRMAAMHPELTGLLGLIDLAREQWTSEPRAVRRGVRDAAVHRFVSVRWWGARGESSPFAEPIDYEDLARITVSEVRHVRRMFFQVVLAVAQDGAARRGPEVMPMELTPYQDARTLADD